MTIQIEIPEYDPSRRIRYNWEDGFQIAAKSDKETIVLSANRAGLISLANHLLNLAQGNIPVGHHMHFDRFTSLEEGSTELIIEKVP